MRLEQSLVPDFMQILREVAQEMCDAADKDDAVTIRSYSGRYMYGRECVGVTLPRGSIPMFSFWMGLRLNGAGDDVDIYDYLHVFGEACIDDMGLDKILYFPAVDWPDETK